MPGQRELLDTEAKLAVTVQEFGAAPKAAAGALAAAQGRPFFCKLGILQHKKPWERRDPQ